VENEADRAHSTAGECQSSWLTSSADHLLSQEEERWGYGEPEGLRRLEVHDQFELCGLLDGQVGGLGTLQNLVDVRGGRPIDARQARRGTRGFYDPHMQDILTGL
jgi:hypothetical protein